MPHGGRVSINARAASLLPVLLAERQAVGLTRYGTGLMTWNGRDARRDLIEELLDALQYALQADVEHRDVLRVMQSLALFHAAAGTRVIVARDPVLWAMWKEAETALAVLPREVVFPMEVR